jgi:serine/threonine-protein kinase
MTNPAQLAVSLAGRYTVGREIGPRRMATVFLARDTKHNRPVALKILNPELGAVLGVERSLAEIRVTANLQHPNLRFRSFQSGRSLLRLTIYAAVTVSDIELPLSVPTLWTS